MAQRSHRAKAGIAGPGQPWTHRQVAEAKGTTDAGRNAGRAAPGGAPARAPLRRLWPIPVLVLAAGMFVMGLVVAFTKRPRPDPTPGLQHATALVEEQRYTDAIEALNKDVRPFFERGLLTAAQEREYHLAMGRAFAGALRTPGAGFGVPFNHEVVVESMLKAERLGAGAEGTPAHGTAGAGEGQAGHESSREGGLTPSDTSMLVESLLALGRDDAAVERINRLPEQESARRTRLTKGVVEHALAAGAGGTESGRDSTKARKTLELLAQMSNTPDLGAADRAWVLARQAELLLASGDADEAINKLIRRIGLLRDVPAPQLAELHLLLGKAYFQADQLANAGKHLELADSLFQAGSPQRADAGVMLARIAQAAGQLEQARDRFQSVMGEFGTSPVYARALLGLAEVLAADRESEPSQRAAIEKYAELADIVRVGEGAGGTGAEAAGRRAPGVSRETLTQSLMRRFDERFTAGKYEDALRFALVAETMYRDNQVPGDVLEGIGRAHRRLADGILEQARAGRAADFRVEDLDQTTRAEIKHHCIAAGEYLRRHAVQVTASDLGAYLRSLWDAADSFDLAGDLDEAKKAFQNYADGAPDNDPNRPAAKFRLAQVYQALKEYAAARAIYSELAESRGKAEALGAAGRWGEKAVVPLAECLLAERAGGGGGGGGNEDEAERLLTGVVDGSTLSPDAAEYRDALVELGTMYYTTGRYAEAIPRLEQAIERYPEDRRVRALRFRLADGHRLEAGAIRKTLEQALPQSQRDELERARAEHLRVARRMFESVKTALAGVEPAHLTGLEKIYLRNAHFYVGDCAFDLKDYDGAVAAYDTARLRYADDPASLVAMAQIVSAYVAQERWVEARTANERARQQLAKFPEEVWSRPDLPMEKRHWERWLDARTQLEQTAHAREPQ